MKTRTTQGRPYFARGASTVEFCVVAPLLAAIGLGTLQAGLAYHARTVLNYATFEAARTGAVNHALDGPMRRELAVRLAPLVGGDGSNGAAAAAIARSMARVSIDPFTRVRIINPSTEAFDHFSIRSRESGKHAIPNSHLRFRDDARAALDPVSGVDLRDANLLKIEVTHGFDMKVPLVAAMARPILILFDPGNALYYAAGKLPLSSVATVRMQSEVWRDSLVSMTPAVESGADVPGASAVDPATVVASNTPDPVEADSEGDPADDEPVQDDTDQDTTSQDTTAQECESPFARSDPFLPTVDDQVCAAPGAFGEDPASSAIEPAVAGSGQHQGAVEC